MMYAKKERAYLKDFKGKGTLGLCNEDEEGRSPTDDEGEGEDVITENGKRRHGGEHQQGASSHERR
jgi:hypothetical protein